MRRRIIRCAAMILIFSMLFSANVFALETKAGNTALEEAELNQNSTETRAEKVSTVSGNTISVEREEGTGTPIPSEWANLTGLEQLEVIGTSEGNQGDVPAMQAVAGHGTISSDPTQEGASFSNNTTVDLKYVLCSYGDTTDSYMILIENSQGTPLAMMRGTFPEKRGVYELTISWNTTNINKYPPGIYTIIIASTYMSSGEMLNESYTYNVRLEDYKLVSIRNFVARLYSKVLGRQPDAAGMDTWSNALYTGKMTGGQVVQNFFNSTEFNNKNVTDEQYVDFLYETLFDRKADAGKKTWTDVLSSGVTRTGVLKGFVDSEEFATLCANYGIIKGTIPLTENRDLNYGATGFVYRLYTVALEREADVKGLNDWTGWIVNKQQTPQQVAYGFIFSSEFINKNYSDYDYCVKMYRVFLNREPDGAGISTWVGLLDAGKSRKEVFDGFVNSVEFTNLIKSYGL